MSKLIHMHVIIEKKGLETQIASETHKDPVSEVTDGCESAKKMYWMT